MNADAAVPSARRLASPFRISLPWPPGTGAFALKAWLALAIGLYAAFFFQLSGAASTGVSILILAQPTQGMVLSKAIYRTAGTLVGAVAALILTAAFPQDRTMLVAGFAVWMGLMTAFATLLRDFRAYGCVLAGYTVAIISITNIDAPHLTFSAAINRVAAILVGVGAITLANILLARDQASRSVSARLLAATRDLIGMVRSAMADRTRPSPEASMAMAARLMALRTEISFATPERPNAWARSAGGRSAVLGLFEALSVTEAVASGLSRMTELSTVAQTALEMTQTAIGRQDPERCLPRFDALVLADLKAGHISIDDAHLLDRLHFLIVTLGDVRDGLRAMRTGRPPRRRVALPVHQDYVAVVLNATRVIVAMAVISILSIWSGIPGTAGALLIAAVFVSLGSLLPNPRAMGNAGLIGMPIVALLSAFYVFFVFPNIDGYPLFILSLAPLVLLMCWLIMIGQPGYGLIIGVLTLTQADPANVQTLDPNAFVASAIMLVPAGIAIFAAFRLVLPVVPAQRRLRLALGIGRSLRNALADKERRARPRASLHYDRLSQFMTWQGRAAPTLARHKTMLRLVDLGLLAFAVRRSWRALDRSRPHVPAALDARARHVLPKLSREETEAIAQDYLGRAYKAEGDAALALVHTAAALHGTAVSTGDELRLLPARQAGLARAEASKAMKEFIVAGLLITPFVRYALLTGVLMLAVRWLLVRNRFYRWFWNPLLAEAGIFICLLALLNIFA